MAEARVVHEDDVASASGHAAVRTLVGRDSGSEQLRQRVLHLAAGASVELGHPRADDALYVARGVGRVDVGAGGPSVPLEPGTALLVPPGVPAAATNEGDEDLVLVSVLSPPPFDGVSTTAARDGRIATVREDERTSLPAGEDRAFRLLIGPEQGARNVTQFVGFIERSKAPPHTHTYEEAIYIVEGEGVVHVGEDRHVPIRLGSSIFLPPGIAHCLENVGTATLKLLGVFSPPGSPAAKMERA